MRDYTNIDKYLDELEKDIYPQPADMGHTAWATDVIQKFCKKINVSNVLDVGCGQGFCQPIFESRNIEYEGVTLGESDINIALERDRSVSKADCTFLPYPDAYFDLIFARHILEHSPMPLITLMEWHRVSKKYLIIVFPAWEYWLVGGRNHYSMLNKDQLWYLLDRSGWNIVEQYDFISSDLRFMEFFRLGRPENDRQWIGEPKIVEYRYLLEKRQ